MVHMYDDGYSHLTAFDYAEEGIENAKTFFGDRYLVDGRQQNDNKFIHGVDLLVADARKLPFELNTFDAVLEKGTFDAIYLSGGKDKDLAREHLNMAVSELSRVICPGGIVMSITAACADAVDLAFQSFQSDWEVIRDGNFYITEDGFASNNVDATILAWRRLQ
jgi:ubiquinone/menaquinone biosynthesis C-methylase UbiE